MKRIVLFVLSLWCVLVTCTAQQRYTVRETAVYDGPETWYTRIFTAPKGTMMNIRKTAKDGWVMVSFGNNIGYVQSSNLTTKKPVVVGGTTNGGSEVEKKEGTSEIHITHHNRKLSGSDIYERYNSAVFMIFTMDSDEKIYQGSGFFVNEHGLAVSNNHVFEDMEVALVKIPNSNEVYTIKKVVARSVQPDFILFEVDVEGNRTNYIPLSKTEPKVGEQVFAIASPQGLSNTFSSGEISAWRDEHLMQISNPIDHGSSGGALINTFGEVVGITTGTFNSASSANLNYAWSILSVIKHLKW